MEQARYSGQDVICHRCVESVEIAERIMADAQEAECTRCHRAGPCWAIATLCDVVDPIIRAQYYPVPDEFSRERWQSPGERPSDVLQGLLGVDEEVAASILENLAAREGHDVADGDVEFYGDNDIRARSGSAYPFAEIWDRFEERFKHHARFFDDAGRADLDALFKDLPLLSNGEALRVLSANERSAPLFRARVFTSSDEAEAALNDPARHMGPPPARLTRAGRMNPAGVPAFYGAFASEVAVAEVRPAVGSIVIVARFFPTRDLRVLDLTKLARLYAQDSRFSESYATTLSRLKFLRSFESRISRVVLPSDELIDYLPTQAVAAYVTNVLGLDGIIYRSRQVIPDGYEMSGAESLNIALFGSAANVQDTDTWEPAPRPEYFHVLVAPFITPLIEAYERERFRRGLRKGGGLRIELTPPPAALLTTRVTVGSKPLDVHSLDDNRFTIVDVDDLYERDDDDD